MAKKRHGRLASSSAALHTESDDEPNRSSKRRRLQRALPRESKESKAAIVDHLHRVRLERAVERGRRQFRRYVVPSPPQRSMGWKLRGAARPWEEVEAAKVADHHAPTVDAIALHGHALCETLGDSARNWRDALVDLARLRLDGSDLEAGMKLLGEALSIDAADERGASLVALHDLLGSGVEGEWCETYLTSSRALPRWTLFLSRWFRSSEPRAKLLEEAIQANPFAPWCLAFPDSADAAIEYAEEIGCRFTPAGILEALHVHLHTRKFFESRPSQRASIAKDIQQRADFSKQLPSAPDEPHDNARMFVNMFATLQDMVSENLESQPVSRSSV